MHDPIRFGITNFVSEGIRVACGRGMKFESCERSRHLRRKALIKLPRPRGWNPRTELLGRLAVIAEPPVQDL